MTRDEVQHVVDRLMAVVEQDQALGDPRVPGVVLTWSRICEDVPDGTLKTLIPGIVRLLFRKRETAVRLEACGLRPGLALQHEAITPYVVAFRRMRAIRRHGGAVDASRLLVETRQELRDLNSRFHQALDEAMRLQEENSRLRIEVKRCQTEMAEHRRAATLVRGELEEVATKALNKLALALQNLKESMERRLNDPQSSLIERASLAVQSYYMVLEDLGHGPEAMKLARRILGTHLAAVELC